MRCHCCTISLQTLFMGWHCLSCKKQKQENEKAETLKYDIIYYLDRVSSSTCCCYYYSCICLVVQMDFQLALIFVVTLLSTQKIFPQCRYSRPKTKNCEGHNLLTVQIKDVIKMHQTCPIAKYFLMKALRIKWQSHLLFRLPVL